MVQQPSKAHLEQVVQFWNLNSELKLHRRVENFIYFSSVATGDVVVRLTEPIRRKKAELCSELDWQLWLSRQGISCAHPFESVNGRLVEELESNGVIYYASVFERLSGTPVRGSERFTPELMRSWGRLLASLHNATVDYQPSEGVLPRWGWAEDFERTIGSPQQFDATTSSGKQIHEIHQWLCTLPTNKEVYGLVHTDLHSGNFLVNSDNRLQIFDLDDSCYHWFAYDLAVPLFYLRFGNFDLEMGLDLEALESFYFEGYREVRVLDASWFNRIEGFIRLRTLIMSIWCSRRLRDKAVNAHLVDWCEKYMSWCEGELRTPIALS